MVCGVCQKFLAIFWSLIESWSKSRSWSDDDTKVDGGDFGSISISAVGDENIKIKYDKQKKNNLTCNGSSNDNSDLSRVKMENDDLLDYSESVYFSTGSFKKEETKEDEDAVIEDMQLKAEEVEIKDEEE